MAGHGGPKHIRLVDSVRFNAANEMKYRGWKFMLLVDEAFFFIKWPLQNKGRKMPHALCVFKKNIKSSNSNTSYAKEQQINPPNSKPLGYNTSTHCEFSVCINLLCRPPNQSKSNR